MSVLDVLPMPGCEQAQIKFNQYKYYTKAPFFIYAGIKSILEPLGRQVKQTTLSQQHKMCATAAIQTSTFFNFD